MAAKDLIPEYDFNSTVYDKHLVAVVFGITVTVHSIDIDEFGSHRVSDGPSRRVVVPGLPHHVTQRGNGRARTFFGDADYALYRDLLAEHCRAARSRSGPGA